jgi:hypothetical protein
MTQIAILILFIRREFKKEKLLWFMCKKKAIYSYFWIIAF